ncbi:MAG TPA: phage integrase SAM-like domain-containing protein [Chitinophagaceae bacterium]|nr:phage integrase SAM-like domain-containing protein [Chitinophagaceae bacterium]
MESDTEEIAEFVKFEFGQNDLDVSEIEYSFATKFHKYLTIEREKVLQEAAAKKQIKNTKQLLSMAESNNFVSKNPIQKFRCGGDDTDVPPLELHQVLSCGKSKSPYSDSLKSEMLSFSNVLQALLFRMSTP